jgi:TetR/AcrR family transcriptional regulator, transcriptional repressor for nem operon
LQGAFILAKGANDAQRAVESVDHLRRYIELLFARIAFAAAIKERPARAKRSI